MALVRNLGERERVARVAAGVILVVVGLFVSGYWKPFSIVVGVGLALSGAVGF